MQRIYVFMNVFFFFLGLLLLLAGCTPLY